MGLPIEARGEASSLVTILRVQPVMIASNARFMRRPATQARRFSGFVAWICLTGLVAMTSQAAQPAEERSRSPVRSLLEMRHDKVVVQEWDLSCGSAALATILRYQFDDPVPEKVIARDLMRREEYLANPLMVRARQGFSMADLKVYVDRRGYLGMGFGQLTMSDLLEMAPAIVPVNFAGYSHFVVFRGAFGNRVLLADPAYGSRTMRRDRFEAAWIKHPKFGAVGFTVTRPDAPALANQLAPTPNDFVSLY
jgi:predicted double-glycine peptidase